MGRKRLRLSGLVLVAVWALALGETAAVAQASPRWVASCQAEGQANIYAGVNDSPYVPQLGAGIGEYEFFNPPTIECQETNTGTGETSALAKMTLQSGQWGGWVQPAIPGVCGTGSAGSDVNEFNGGLYVPAHLVGDLPTSPWDIYYHIDYKSGVGSVQILPGSTYDSGAFELDGGGAATITPVPGPQTPTNNICAEAVTVAGTIYAELQ